MRNTNDLKQIVVMGRTFFLSSRGQSLGAFLLILFFAGLNLVSVRREFSVTTDEDKHFLYGERIVAGDPARFNPSTMPVTGLNALPEKLASWMEPGPVQHFLSKYYVARAVTILFSCLVAYLVFYWARSLYGFIPALFSLTLYILDPNIIAHSQLVTTDLYTVGSTLFVFFALWKFTQNRNVGNGILSLFALGLSQLAKYSSIVLLPLCLVALIVHDLAFTDRVLPVQERMRDYVVRYTRYALYAALASILIINLGFLLDRTFTSFGEYNFRSTLLQGLQTEYPILNSLPVPMPYPYLEGLDFMNNVEQNGAGAGNIYLLGQIRTGEGFPGYYFVATLLKTPIASQVMIALALALYCLRGDLRKRFFQDELFLFVPVLFYVVYFNFLFKTQVGIRYFLPVFPFLYVFTGSLFVLWDQFSIHKRLAFGFLVGYLFVSVISYHPYYLSYFNEIVWDRKLSYQYLSDSNIDWGQARLELDQYLTDHPDAVYRPGKVRAGHLVVRVNELTGVTVDPGKYAWLRDHFEPVDTIAYGYLIYNITPEDVGRLCATTDYCKP
jgi:hypothetical protein